MNYNSIITVYRAIISNCSYENSFQSKVYSTHTKQRLVSQAVVVEYSQENNLHKEIKDNDNWAKCFPKGGQRFLLIYIESVSSMNTAMI